MFLRNVQSPVWIRRIGVQLWYTKMAAEKRANIDLNLLWLPRPLAICDEQTIIYINTFPNTLSSQMAKIHEISTYFFDKQYRNFVSRSATTVKL